MAIVDGNPISAAYTNSVMSSLSLDQTQTGVRSLANVTDVNSGASITNIQQRMNELSTQTGQVDGDANNLVYSSNNVVVDSENLKQSIERLDAKFTNIALNEISDVDAAAPNNGDVIAFNNVSGNWEAVAQSGGGATELDDLTDVTITAVAANQKLKRNAGNTLWENVDDTLGSLTDVDVAGAINGQSIQFNNVSGNWELFTPAAGVSDINDLGDVNIVGIADNNLLQFNNGSGNWENVAGPAGAVVGDSDAQTLTNKTIVAANNTLTVNVNDLNDVDAAAPNNGDVLAFNNISGNYEPIAPAAGGGGFLAISTQAVDFAPADQNAYLIDNSGGAINVNLPAPAALLQFTIKVLGDALTNPVTLVRNAAENIEGSGANFVINNQLGAYNVISDGTDWFLI